MNKRKKRLLISGVVLIVACGIYNTPPVYKLRGDSIRVQRPTRKGISAAVELGPKVGGWLRVSSLSRHVIQAIVVAEDAKFFDHFGFDLLEIWRSFLTNQKADHIVRGGSTITQQVIKMAFLTREKTYTRKFQELLGAVAAELILPKQKILEWYVNLAEFGPGVYGIRYASQHYFQTPAELLTIQQSIHLALVLPSPNRYSKGLRKRQLTQFGHERYAWILGQLLGNGYISKNQRDQVMATGNFGAPIVTE